MCTGQSIAGVFTPYVACLAYAISGSMNPMPRTQRAIPRVRMGSLCALVDIRDIRGILVFAQRQEGLNYMPNGSHRDHWRC